MLHIKNNRLKLKKLQWTRIHMYARMNETLL